MQARMRRDFDAVERLGAEILAANPAHAFTHRALARQFDELGAPENSLSHWRALREADPKDFEASFHLARAHTQAGDALGQAVSKAAPGATATLHRNLEEVLEDKASRPPCPTDVHTIMICGVSFSGSTLLDRLLGGLPAVKSIGESHWLTKGRDAQGYGPIDFGTEDPIRPVPCTCGPNCPVLDLAFRRRLAADHTNWFFNIAEQLGTKTLVCADKNPPKIADHDPLMRLDGLVLFKSLPQAWLSELNKKAPGESPGHWLEACRKYADVWTDSYRTFVEDFSPAGNKVVLSFEDFARRPRELLEKVATSLGLEFDDRVFTSIQPGHAIGGNGAAMARLREASYVPDITPLPPCEIPASHREIIEEHAGARDVFERLQGAHERLAGS